MSGQLPDFVGPYRIEGVLGQGGMGIVYSGVHKESGSRAAIKTVYEHESSRLVQIRREIRSLARLHHPGVVRILDYGVSEGLPWYAMEQLEGATLRDVFDRLWQDANAGVTGDDLPGPPDDLGDDTEPTPSDTVDDDDAGLTSDSADELTGGMWDVNADAPPGDFRMGQAAAGGHLIEGISLLRGVCDTLAFLHGEGVVHRDLKPRNIFIRDTGEPVLVDFGLAEDASGSTGRERIHAAQKLFGSPAYMSPEQIRGEALDARSDLYAIGCILYQFLTGQAPFAGSSSQTIQGHLKRAPLVPSTLVADVPTGLDQVVISLLTKDQNDRLGYAETLANVLADMGAGAPPWSDAPPPSKPYLYRSSFVGRRDMLSALKAKAQAAKAGTGGFVLISGESGSGKTRLALETGSISRRLGLEVITGDCVPLGEGGAESTYVGAGMPLAPFRPLVDAMVDQCVEKGMSERERLFDDRIALLAAYFPVLRSLPGVVDLPAPPPLPSAAARDRLFRALGDSLAAYLADRQVLLVVDDLQWADDLTHGFLRHLLVEDLVGLPLLLVGTFRSEERTPGLDALCGDRRVDSLTLARMGADEVGQMTRGMLAMPTPPDGFFAFLADRSGGNPFFIAEYLRAAVSEQVLVRDRFGRWSLDASNLARGIDYQALPLPSSLRQLIEMRLAKLGDAERRVVNVAALMGRIIDVRVLRVAERLSDGVILDLTDTLVSRQIIELADAENFRFVHAKIGEITEAALSPDLRKTVHARLADAYEAVYPPGPAREDKEAAIGRHWALADEPRRALPHLRAAADRAREVHSVTEAIGLYAAALRETAALRAAGDRSADLRFAERALNERHGDVLALQNKHEAARTAFTRAIADMSGDQEGVARLHRKRGKTFEIEHDHDAALEAYLQAQQAVGEPAAAADGARNEWIQVILDRAWVYYWQNNPEKIDAELETARPFIEEGGLASHRYHYFMALVNRNHRRNRYRVPADTLTFARKMLEAAEDSGAAAELAFAHFILGFALLFAGNLDEAEAELFEASQACRRIGDAAGETRAMAYLAILHRRKGEVAATARIADRLMAIATQRGMDDYLGVAQAAQSWIAWRGGDADRAAELCLSAMATWDGLSFPYPFQWTAGLVALALAVDGRQIVGMPALARHLREAPQLHLPDPIHDALGAVEASATPADFQLAANYVVAHSVALGFL